MKKILVIALLLTYGLSSSGMTLHLHYCCGKLDKVDFTPVPSKCGKTHKMGTKPCCDNKEVTFKVKSEQSAVKILLAAYPLTAVKPFLSDFLVSAPVEAKKLLPEVFAPPPVSQDFNTLFCVFRI